MNKAINHKEWDFFHYWRLKIVNFIQKFLSGSFNNLGKITFIFIFSRAFQTCLQILYNLLLKEVMTPRRFLLFVPLPYKNWVKCLTKVIKIFVWIFYEEI